MNTEKLEKLKKSLDNKFIPDSMKDKIRTEIQKLQSEIKEKEVTPTEIKEEIKNIEVKVDDAIEVAEKKEEKEEKATKKAKPTTDKKSKPTAMALAKEIRKEGETWKDAVARARKEMKGVKEEVKKETKSEIAKLKSLIRKRKDLKGVSSSDLMRDGHIKALPSGKRTSSTGHTYYENRRNRTDKGKVGDLYLAQGGALNSYNVIYSTKSGRTMVAKNIMATNKAEAEAKLKKEMRASSTFDKVVMVHESFAKGGTIPNNYEGKTSKEIWNIWNKDQKEHFLLDHFNNFIPEEFNGKSLTEISKLDYKDLPVIVRKELDYHTSKTEYNNGGFMDGVYAEEGAEVKYIRNKDGIKVKSVAMPEKKLTEAEWLAKHNESREARSYAGGGDINVKELNNGYQYTYKLRDEDDSRGTIYKEHGVYFVKGFEGNKHFSESFEKFADAKKFYLSKKNSFAFGGATDGIFTGYTGTHYTGEVGETNAMSSGEMFADGGGVGDLFENYNEQPEELAEIVNFYMEKFDEGDYDYEDSKNFLKEVEAIGYTFDYGLDNEPYGLRPIGTELNEYADGGAVMQNQQLINDATTNTANMFASEGIYNKGGALKTERRYVNHSQDYETRYARKHTSRHGYGNVKYDGGGQLSQYGKFISSQIEHLISLKTIAAKKEPIQNLLKNMDDYRGTEIEKRITTDNLKYALQQKTVSKMNEVLRISLNALKD